MHPDTADAVRILQERLRSAETRDFRRAERYEAALDDLVRNPGRSGPVGHLVRNATSHGRRRAVRRARLAPRHEPKPVIDDTPMTPREVLVVDDTGSQLEIELRDLIDRAPLQPADRLVMRDILGGATPADIAEKSNVPRGRLDVRVSRARARLRAVA